METKNLIQRGNKLEVTFNVNLNKFIEVSPEFSIYECATFQVMAFIVTESYRNLRDIPILVRFFKNCQDDNSNYSITLFSQKLGIAKKRFLSDDDTWHLIKRNNQASTFDISVVMDIVNISPFEALHDDTELADFELRGEDGSVKIHKAVLAVSSHVLRRMLSGSWREATKGHVKVPGTSAQTLQHFKDYIYLHKLPDTDLEQILLLASCYAIPDLEQKCVFKLISNLTAENTYDLLEFAVKHKVTSLVLAILDFVQKGGVSVKDMSQYFSTCKDNNRKQ